MPFSKIQRFMALTSLGVLLLVPLLDQIACAFCGPSPETSATAKAVPHSEDECILQDGFERKNTSSDTEESTHIHFCILHSTSVTVGDIAGLSPNIGSEPLVIASDTLPSLFTTSLFHPPRRV